MDIRKLLPGRVHASGAGDGRPDGMEGRTDDPVLGLTVSRRGVIAGAAALAGQAALGLVPAGITLLTPAVAGAAGFGWHDSFQGMEAMSIRTKNFLLVRDAKKTLNGSFVVEDWYGKNIEDGQGEVDSHRGSQYQTIFYQGYLNGTNRAVPGSFTLRWDDVGIDANGTHVDLLAEFYNIVIPLATQNSALNRWGTIWPLLGTYYDHPTVTGIVGGTTRMDVHVRLLKRGTNDLASGTYLACFDDIDSRDGFNGMHPAEAVYNVGGWHNQIYFKSAATYGHVYIDVNAGRVWANGTYSNAQTPEGSKSYDLDCGFVAPTNPDFRFRVEGGCYQTALFGQPFFPVWLQTSVAGTGNGAVIPDGVYRLESAARSGLVLDCDNGGTSDVPGRETNVLTWSWTGATNQMFQVTNAGGGAVTIAPVHNLAARLDAAGPNVGDGSNVRLREASGYSAQRWLPVRNGDGTYTLVSGANGNVALDVFGAMAGVTVKDGTNVDVWTKNGSPAQRWRLTRVRLADKATLPMEGLPPAKSLGGSVWYDVYRDAGCTQWANHFLVGASDYQAPVGDAGAEYGKNLKQGRYWIRMSGDAPSWMDPDRGVRSFVIDGDDNIWNMNKLNVTNDVYGASPVLRKTGATRKDVSLPDGTYRIRSHAGSGRRVLDVTGEAADDAANVEIWEQTDSLAQFWELTNLGGDWVKLSPACNALQALDVYGGGSDWGTNVDVWPAIGSAGQRWHLDAAGDGSFYLTPGCAQGCHLDVADGRDANGANVRIWAKNTAPAQRFAFELVEGAVAGARVIDAKSVGDGTAPSVAGAEYTVFLDRACTKAYAKYVVAGTNADAVPKDAAGRRVTLWATQDYWLKETRAAPGYALDPGVRYLRASSRGLASPRINVSDRPDRATLTFVVVTNDGHKDIYETVHTATVPIGTTVRDGQGPFADADGKARGKLGEHVFGQSWGWYEDKDAKRKGLNADGSAYKGRFTSKVVEGNLTLHIFVRYGGVLWYCDGTSDEAWPRGNLVAKQAIVAYGTWVAPNDDARGRSTLPNCTPGWVGWYTDPDAAPLHPERAADAAVASADAAAAAEAPFAGKYLSEPVLRLYAANLATTSFVISSGSERLPEDGASYFTRDDRGHESPVDGTELGAPGPEVARVRSTQRKAALPPVVYERLGGGRVRTHRSVSWCADEPCATPGTTSWTVEGDSTRWGSWHESVADGVVDERG